MNNEKLIINNEELNVGAEALKSAQETKHKNNATPVGASIARPFRKNQGITLIALIITIIVMLILAGVVLNLTIGERGIFKTAQNASKEYEIERIKEKVNLEILDLSSQKLAKREKLTVEEALIGIQEREVFEEIDMSEETGICEGYVISLGYDENRNVIIEGLEKDIDVRIQVSLNPKGYTNGTVEAKINIKSSNKKISKIEIPEGLTKKEEGTYEIEKNGTYLIKATLDTGEIVEKEIKIATIDKLAPKEFTIEEEEITNGFKIKAQAEDAEATEENVKSGISHYEYYVNGEKKASNEIIEIAQGTYNVYVVAFDKAGNSTKSKEIDVTITRKVSKTSAGNYYSLAIDESGNMWGYGQGAYGKLGIGSSDNYYIPMKIETEVKFKDIVAGNNHSLALDENGNIWSWGNNQSGQLGDGSTTNHLTPTKIETEVKFKEIAIGNKHSIALDENGNLWSWGYNGHGQLGDGSTTNHLTPTKIETEVKFKEISAENNHNLAIDENGNIWSWGWNAHGELGDGTKNSSNMPIKIDMGETKFKEISAGYDHNLALDENGNIWSWGNNNYGQLGDGSTNPYLSPMRIETEIKFKEISAGRNHSLAIDENGKLWDWGNNQLVLILEKCSPTQIETEVKFKEISAGYNHSLAIDENGNIWSWGYNGYGQLGDGTADSHSSPSKIIF